MKKSGPKLSKKILTAAKFQENASAKNEHKTAEDYMEDGAIDEESGDRWHSSDLSKGLRFYQKAFDNYRCATTLGSLAERDLLLLAYYNALRLLFHVYTQYQRTDGVQLSDLSNIHEVLDAGAGSVVQGIQTITEAHESSIQFAGADAPTDLLFNTAMVYVDAIEEAGSSADSLAFARRSMGLLKDVLERQVSVLQAHASGSMNAGTVEPENSLASASDVLDTVVSVFNLAQTLYESVGSSEHGVKAASSLMGLLLLDADQIASELLREAANISDTRKHEYLVAKAYACAASAMSLDDVTRTWDDALLPNSPERYMLAADCIDSFMQRSGVSSGPASAPDTYWAALTKMNLYFKAAQDLLNERLAAAKAGGASGQQIGVGAIISQVAKIHIARSDIDLQRAQLPLEQAQKNLELLSKNAKAFLKNAMAVAKQSGGIREKSVEKVQREKRRVEAACRLCVLEGKASEPELDSIVGHGRWQADIEECRDLWYFPLQ